MEITKSYISVYLKEEKKEIADDLYEASEANAKKISSLRLFLLSSGKARIVPLGLAC